MNDIKSIILFYIHIRPYIHYNVTSFYFFYTYFVNRENELNYYKKIYRKLFHREMHFT